jgi:outer membrane receptor for ferric coprogen and ferric-rhodotorulic acid
MKTPTTAAKLTTVIAACLTLANIAPAQSVPTAPVKPPSTGTILFTPFEVSSASDNGYAATETLAGTRLRTNLRDIGASLSILTPEFMRDLGVNSYDQALLYTPSVDASEGDNTDANRASGSQMRFGTGQSYSIRGFNTNAGNQSASHDFFTALDPADNYNVERVTLSLGPNALLIGVGNPQGTTNALVGTNWQLRRPRNFILTSTFEF